MRIAVLGLGSIGLRHARNLAARGLDVIGFDPDREQCIELEVMGQAVGGSREELLAVSDAVVIASPSELHLDDLAATVEAGCHALVEKPIGHTVAGFEALFDSADEQGLCIFSGMNLRFHPAVQAAKADLDRGRIGTLLWARLLASSYLPDWRPEHDYRQGYAADPVTGGVLFDIIHEFDLAHHLLGSARTVSACARTTGQLDIPSEDCADVILRHPGDVHSTLHLDYVTRPARRVTEISGTEGFLRLDLAARVYTAYNSAGEPLEENHYDSSFDDDYNDEIGAFLSCIETGNPPLCDGRESLAVMRQVLAARQLSGLPSP